MSEVRPVLLEIHDCFDTYDRYPYTDHTVISGISIASGVNGYRVTTYPGGIGYANDGLVLDIRASGGIFGDAPPDRVETSRDHGTRMNFTADATEELEDGSMRTSGTFDSPVAREGLVLPGDDGFALFNKLHTQLGGLKGPLVDIVGTVGITIDKPSRLTLYERDKFAIASLGPTRVTHHGKTCIELGNETDTIKIELDGRAEVGSIGESAPMTYVSGTLETNDLLSMPTPDLLLAFEGFQARVRSLHAIDSK